jgi:ATP-dependent Clp protease protease subunit
MYKKIGHGNSSNRIITIGDITKESSFEIIKFIYDINEKDKNKAKDKREPIKLLMNSLGGEVYDGLAIVDAIETSNTPVYTVGFGAIMSMALVVYVAGEHRIAGKNTTFMYHETAYDTEGKIKFHKQELKEAERTDSMCDKYILDKTKLSQQQLSDMRNTQGDWYFDTRLAKQYGIVHEILK